MVLWLAQQLQWLQNIYIRFQTAIPPVIVHNVGKIEIIRKAFHQITTEHLEGSYFEFGVYEGNSLLAALRTYLRISSPKSVRFYNKKFKRNFYGFDSFDDGFKYLDNRDAHPFFKEGDFSSSFKKCARRFRKNKNVTLVKGYFEDTVGGKNGAELFPGESCAILFIDCDLTNPALLVLEFMKSLMKKGTIIILDDYYAYGGDTNRGTAGALSTFLNNNPNIRVREFFQYGYNGKSFIIFDI